MTKSIQHDATPSWNGFNYQGKVGVYVCLTMILDALKGCGKDSNSFKEFIESHSIQYEWIEDFSILKDGQYVSHHQVKHKAETGFSTHIDALVTILNRTQKILSTSDLARYLNNKNSEETNIQALKEMKALELDGSLNPNWRKIPGIEESEYYTCLDEFDQFSANAFDKSRIYFHTSETVSEPEKDLSTYEDIKANTHLSSKLKGKKTLKSLKDLEIYLGEDQDHPYRLVISDDELVKEIQSLIDKLLSKIHMPADYQSFTVDDKAIYFSALLRELDTHICYRHHFFHNPTFKEEGLLQQRPAISFESFYSIFEKTFKEQNKEYWEIYCQQGFELAYSEQWDILDQMKIDHPHNKALYEGYQKNLEKFRLYFIPQFYGKNYKGFLKKLSPHTTKNESELPLFYRKISNSDNIQNVFLDFIREINLLNNEDNLSYKSKDDKSYFPSAVNLEHRKKDQQTSLINTFKRKMADLPYKPTYYLKHADYYVTNARNPEDIDDKNFHLNSITELNENQLSTLPSNKHSKSNSSQNTISAHKKLKFRHYETAIKELKDE